MDRSRISGLAAPGYSLRFTRARFAAVVLGVASTAATAASRAGEPHWTAGVPVSQADGFDSSRPRIAAGSAGGFHVAWEESSISGEAVAYRQVGGSGRKEALILSRAGVPSHSPEIAVDREGRPHVVWLERFWTASNYRVMYSALESAGGAWSAPRAVSSVNRLGREGSPHLFIDRQGQLQVLWSDDLTRGNSEVYWSRLESGGWGFPEPISQLDDFHSGEARFVEVPDSDLAALWLDRRQGQRVPWVRLFRSGVWEAPILIHEPSSEMNGARLASSGSLLYFCFASQKGLMVSCGSLFDLYWAETSVLPLSVPGAPFEAHPLADERLLLVYVDQAGDRRLAFMRSFDGRSFRFEGFPESIDRSMKDPRWIRIAARRDPAGEGLGGLHVFWHEAREEYGGSEEVFQSRWRTPEEELFRRGDVDGSGEVDLSDAVGILGHLFSGEFQVACEDAADADDDGELVITDAIFLLAGLFLDGPPPPSPYPDCGVDLTPEALDCQISPGCS